MAEKVLVVEDNDGMRRMLVQLLTEAGYGVEQAGSAEDARRVLQAGDLPVVVTDLKLPRKSGLDVLRDAKRANPRAQVILLSAYGTVETAVTAMKDGAFDFLSKPFDNDHLLLLVRRAMEFSGLERENTALREAVRAQAPPLEAVGKSAAFRKALALAGRVAGTDSAVLLSGESGTGKEVVARLIHAQSPRARGPFVAVSCAALPESLLESELFGHEKGSFTGAVARRSGRVEMAAGGTLFLDEISEVPPSVQVKILRVLQEHTIERVGGSATLPVDFRLIAATNRDLTAAVKEGRFREDLYYRLAVFPISLPPLRERREDIPVLALHFATRRGGGARRNVRILPKALELLRSYAWPGNVRELQNAVERALILSSGPALTETDFGFLRPAGSVPGKGDIKSLGRSAKITAERVKILEVLKEVGGNKLAAARKLGISYKTLLSRLKE